MVDSFVGTQKSGWCKLSAFLLSCAYKFIRMIATSIIVGMEQGVPVWHKSDGFAKNEQTAKWLYEYCGWTTNKHCQLLICEGVVEWPESDLYFPCNMTELWVLGSCLHLNWPTLVFAFRFHVARLALQLGFVVIELRLVVVGLLQ